MSISVENGSLDFVSRLDNSDFQAKSLQDLKLIELRLRLTGDTSGVTKYDEAVKAALETETKLRADLAKILEDAQIQTQEFIKTVQQQGQTKTVFSDSVAEVRAYNEALQGLESGAAIVADLNAQLDALVVNSELLKTQLESGAISEAEYSAETERITVKQIELVESIKRVNDAFATNVIVQDENITQIAKTNTAIAEEIGILEELKISLAELKGNQITITDPILLAKNNKALQETEAEIKRFSNVGKVGFDSFGQKIEETTPKVGKMEAAVSRVTNIQNIGARVVTQFTRQIIGLGVGFLSLEIGAKAIESLIKYIQNLDYFTGRLDQAKQNLLALNAVMADADKAAGSQIGALRELYDAATNANLSLKERLQAAEQLRDSYAAEFQNASDLAIINGKLKGSYDELTASILKEAEAAAASQKIKEIAGKILESDFQKEKIRNAAQAQLARVKGDKTTFGNASSISGGGAGQTATISEEDQRKTIIEQEKIALFKEDQNQKIYNNEISFLEKKTNGITKKSTDLQKANKLLGEQLQNFNSLIQGSTDLQQLENIKNALQIKLNALAPGDAQIAIIRAKLKQVDDLEKQYQVKAGSKGDPSIAQGQSLLASQKSLLQNVDALKSKYAAKDEDRDKQAIEALKASFTKQYNEIVAFNVKRQEFIDRYNKTHKGGGEAYANSIGLVRQDTGQLQAPEAAALAGLSGQQSLEKTKDLISRQKVLFTEYEDFKLKAGTEAANQLFGNELSGYKNYVDYLKSLQPTETDLTSADPYTKARANALSDFLKTELPKAQNDELKLNQKHLQDLIIQDQDWQQKRLTLIAIANEEIKALQAAGFQEQAKQAADNLKQQLTNLEESGFETQAQYRKLFSNVTELSTEAAQTQIKNAQAMAQALYDAGLLTDDAYKKITDDLQKLAAAVNDRQFDKIDSIGRGLQSIGSAFQGINDGFSSYISNLGSLATSLANVGKQYDQIGKDAGDADKQLTDEINLISTGIAAVSDLVSIITSSSAARKKAAEDYYNSVIAFQQQYNVALDEEIQLRYKTNGNLFFTNTAQELSDAAKAYDAASTQYQQSLVALQSGEAIVGKHNAVDGKNVGKGIISGATAGAVVGSVVPVIGTVVGAIGGAVVGAIAGIFGGKKKVDTLAPLLATYPQLIDANGKFNESLAKTLVANNQVNDATKTLLNNTIAYYDEEKSALDQITSALTDLVGQLGSGISDALTQAFENGQDAAKAFGSTVSNVLSNIVQQDLFQAIFGPQLTALQQKLTADSLANDGNTSAEIIADIENFYKTAGPLVSQFTDGLKAAKAAGDSQGLKLFDPNGTGSKNTLSGGIQASITESTANILEGTLKGIQLNTFTANNILGGHSLSFGQMISLAQDQLTAVLAIQNNTKRSADNSDLMTAALDAIAQNTKSSVGDQLRSAGKLGF